VKYSEYTRGGNLTDVLEGIETAKSIGFSPIKINCVVRESSDEEEAMQIREFCIQNHLEVRFIRMMNLEEGKFSVVEGGSGGDCLTCSRLRLTSDGKFKPCLFSDLEYDIWELGIENALLKAIHHKPESGG